MGLVEDGCGVYSRCSSFVASNNRSTGLICCGGEDGKLGVYKADGLSDEPIVAVKVHTSRVKACCVLEEKMMPGLGCSVILTAGSVLGEGQEQGWDVVNAAYIDEDEMVAGQGGSDDESKNTLLGILEKEADITCMAVGFTCSLYVGRQDGGLEMYNLLLDRELVHVDGRAAVGYFPYEVGEEPRYDGLQASFRG